ncbi:nitrite reductase small subunit NirD [Kocuria sp. M1R5S2]|uniref:nitrite reductase small subunit NirD n=1 Tax=Kocuria rhizosphaerae TaxID=3376285 RepID=UPI0037A006C0
MTILTAPENDTRAAGLRWHPVCEIDALEVGWGEAALVDGRQVALLRLSATEVHAVDQADPATGAHVMARGIVGSRGEAATIASPLHKEVYALATGRCLTDAGLRLGVHPVRVEDGVVVVGLPAA